MQQLAHCVAQYLRSYSYLKQHQKAAKVLLTTEAIQTDSTFQAKALRRELVKGLCSKRRICLYRLGSE